MFSVVGMCCRFIPKTSQDERGALQSFHSIIYVWAARWYIPINIYLPTHLIRMFYSSRHTHARCTLQLRTFFLDSTYVYRQFHNISSENLVVVFFFWRVFRHAPLVFTQSCLLYFIRPFFEISYYFTRVRHEHVMAVYRQDKNNEPYYTYRALS